MKSFKKMYSVLLSVILLLSIAFIPSVSMAETETSVNAVTKTVNVAKGKKVILYLDINGEMGIYDTNGKPLQGLSTGTALNVPKDYGCFFLRKRICDITESAKGTGSLLQ